MTTTIELEPVTYLTIHYHEIRHLTRYSTPSPGPDLAELRRPVARRRDRSSRRARVLSSVPQSCDKPHAGRSERNGGWLTAGLPRARVRYVKTQRLNISYFTSIVGLKRSKPLSATRNW